MTWDTLYSTTRIIMILIFVNLRRILTGQKANRDNADYAVLIISLILRLRLFYLARRIKNLKKAYNRINKS